MSAKLEQETFNTRDFLKVVQNFLHLDSLLEEENLPETFSTHTLVEYLRSLFTNDELPQVLPESTFTLDGFLRALFLRNKRVLEEYDETDHLWYVDAYKYAADMGPTQFHIIKLLHEFNYPKDASIFSNVARSGDIEMLEWMLENNFPYDQRTFESAATCGQIKVLEWLKSNNFPWDERTLVSAVKTTLTMEEKDRITFLSWFKENGCPCDESVFEYAVNNATPHDIEVLDWIRDNCPHGNKITTKNPEILKWLGSQ